MNTPIEFKQITLLLGVHLTNEITIKRVLPTLYISFMEKLTALYEFKRVPCHVKSKLFATYCLDLYGSQLWNYNSIEVQSFYVAKTPLEVT